MEKIWHLKTTSVPVIEEALGMIKKRTDNIGSPSLYKIQKNCTLQICSTYLENAIKVTEKYYLKEEAKGINT